MVRKNNGKESFGSLLILSRDIYIDSYGKEAYLYDSIYNSIDYVGDADCDGCCHLRSRWRYVHNRIC